LGGVDLDATIEEITSSQPDSMDGRAHGMGELFRCPVAFPFKRQFFVSARPEKSRDPGDQRATNSQLKLIKTTSEMLSPHESQYCGSFVA